MQRTLNSVNNNQLNQDHTFVMMFLAFLTGAAITAVILRIHHCRERRDMEQDHQRELEAQTQVHAERAIQYAIDQYRIGQAMGELRARESTAGNQPRISKIHYAN